MKEQFNSPKHSNLKIGSKKSLIGSSGLVGTVSEGVLESLGIYGGEVSQMGVP